MEDNSVIINSFNQQFRIKHGTNDKRNIQVRYHKKLLQQKVFFQKKNVGVTNNKFKRKCKQIRKPWMIWFVIEFVHHSQMDSQEQLKFIIRKTQLKQNHSNGQTKPPVKQMQNRQFLLFISNCVAINNF